MALVSLLTNLRMHVNNYYIVRGVLGWMDGMVVLQNGCPVHSITYRQNCAFLWHLTFNTI